MSVYRFGRVEVHSVERRVVVDGRAVALGARAVDLLLALIVRRGGLATKARLLDEVWPGLVVEENNVATQVAALRKALGAEAIATVPGYGYRFALAGTEESPATPTPQPAPRLAATNVAPAIEDLIGREADVHAVRAMLAPHRIVTLVGPAGIGKSRVAQEVARAVAATCPDGAWWVDLAAIADPQLIVAAIADAAGLKLASAEREALCVALADRRMLLVLDNCEHLVEAVSPAAAAVARIAGIRLLVTSQAPLKCAAETLHRLDPLKMPDAAGTLEVVRALPAVALLERRARAVDRRFAVTEGNLADIVELCRHLDGLPLAIEMAAARVPVLGPAHLAAQLGQSLELLRNRNEDVPARHRVMNGTLDWSHSLLQAREQRMFRRLATFAGTFTLEAVRAMADDEGVTEAVEDFATLVDRSLVQVVAGDPPRYRLLDTLRLYGRGRLAALGEAGEAEARHRSTMLERARHATRWFSRSSSEEWLPELMPDYDDLEAAFDRACARQDAESAAPLCSVLTEMDLARLAPQRARRRKEAAMRVLPLARGRARGLLLNSLITFRQIRLAGVELRELVAESARVWRELGDPDGLVYALCRVAVESAAHGDAAGYEAALEETAALDSLCGPHTARQRLIQGAFGGWILGRAERVREYAQVMHERSRRLGQPDLSTWSTWHLARAEIIDGDPERAILLLDGMVEEFRDVGRSALAWARSSQWQANAMSTLAAMLLHVGRFEEARAVAATALPLMLQSEYLIWLIDHVALYAAATGRHQQAAWFLGYADARYAAVSEIRPPTERRSAARVREILGSTLHPGELERLCASGALCSEAEVARAAAALLARPPPVTTAPAERVATA